MQFVAKKNIYLKPQPPFLQRHMPPHPDNDVIQHLDVQKLSGLADYFCDRDIFRAGSRVAATSHRISEVVRAAHIYMEQK